MLQSIDIGKDQDTVTVLRDRRLERVRHVILALRFLTRLALTNHLDFRGWGREPKRTFRAIENDWRAVWNFERARFDAGNRGNA